MVFESGPPESLGRPLLIYTIGLGSVFTPRGTSPGVPNNISYNFNNNQVTVTYRFRFCKITFTITDNKIVIQAELLTFSFDFGLPKKCLYVSGAHGPLLSRSPDRTHTFHSLLKTMLPPLDSRSLTLYVDVLIGGG